MIKRLFRFILATFIIVTLLMAVAPAHEARAAGETFTVLSVDNFGCNEFEMFMTVQAAGFDTATTYYQRTVVTSNGLDYMNQYGSFVFSDGIGGWTIFSDSSGGAITGLFPLTAGLPVTIELTLEDSSGNILYVSSVQLSSCNGPLVSISNTVITGAIGVYDKIGQVRVLAPGTRLYETPGGGVVRDLNGDEIWVPNPTAHDPSQDTYDVIEQMEVEGTIWVWIFVGDAGHAVWIPIGGIVSPIY